MCVFLEEQKANALTTGMINWFEPLSHPTSQRNPSKTSWNSNFTRTTANCSPLLGSGVSLFTTFPLIWGWSALSLLIFTTLKVLHSDHLLITQLNALLNGVIKTALQYKDAELCVSSLWLHSYSLPVSSSRDVSSLGRLCWVAHISDATQTSCGFTRSYVLQL